MGQVALRYAVLRHSGVDQPHFDFLVETYPGSELAAWRSPVWPVEAPTICKRLKDHRRIYLDFEGELTGQRGSVERVAGWNCQVEVGENAVWSIRLLNEAAALIFRPLHDDRWSAASI